MNIAHEPTPHDVFLNVRKAYRLLHDYQCMVLDIIRYIRSQLNVSQYGVREEFRYSSWENNALDRSSWAWLPMYQGWIYFWKEFENNRWLFLSFLVISDTGFIDATQVNGEDMVSDFTPAEKSSTKFAFMIHPGWEPLHVFLNDKPKMKAFINGDRNLPDGFIGNCYDMSCLTSELGADKIVKEIRDLARKNGWPLDYRKRPTEQSQPGSNSADQRTAI
jgi:hypothetical protein